MEEKKIDDYLALKVFTKAEASFNVGDREFTMKPLVPKRLRMLFDLVDGLQPAFGNIKSFRDIVPLLNDKLSAIGSIIFETEITQDFIDNNFTNPLGIEIWETFIKLNRLEHILPLVQRAVVIKDKVVPIKEN